MAAPITRLFHLTRRLDRMAEFDAVGEHNLSTSIEVEDGTLAMYSTHMPDDLRDLYVFEVYADDEAYAVHADSPQFKAYVNMAATELTGREVFQLVPRLMLEKPEGLRVTGTNDVEPHLVYVDVAEGGEEDFLTAITANMRTSVEVEPGVLVMYATQMADQPSRWVFWEVYANADAYAAHRETEHFKAYIEATADIVEGKEFFVLAADTLVSKGSLR
ncbi:MAG: antibiotic biosynthesis monooxygenase [Coriobacteriales bacterium]|nr:antibiotic biosynthesis monooxygenase [Coriobacteriales bacterium]